jgi:hypothetical protein
MRRFRGGRKMGSDPSSDRLPCRLAVAMLPSQSLMRSRKQMPDPSLFSDDVFCEEFRHLATVGLDGEVRLVDRHNGGYPAGVQSTERSTAPRAVSRAALRADRNRKCADPCHTSAPRCRKSAHANAPANDRFGEIVPLVGTAIMGAKRTSPRPAFFVRPPAEVVSHLSHNRGRFPLRNYEKGHHAITPRKAAVPPQVGRVMMAAPRRSKGF